MNNLKEIKRILKNALDIQRWASKSNITYSFIEEDEIEEMIKNILKELKSSGYKIVKGKNK